MANYFHVALRGTVHSLVMNLPEGSVHSWADLSQQFVSNFAGTYTHPGVENDLYNIRQRPDETLRQFIQHFSQVRNTIPRVSPAVVIATFRQGVKNKRLIGKMATHNVESVVELFALADRVAREAEAQELVPTTAAVKSEKPAGNLKESGNKKNKRKAVAAFGPVGQGRPPLYPGKPREKKQ